MNIKIKKGTKAIYLDLQGTTITVVKKNLIFYKKDASALTGNHVFPFTIPASIHNLISLDYPNLLNTKDYTAIFQATIEIGSDSLSGKIEIKSSTESKIKLRFQGEVSFNIKNLTLRNLKFDPINLGSDGAAYAKSTAENPLDHDAIFFPVLNQGFFEDDNDLVQEQKEFHNYYSSATQSFLADENHPIITPFVRVDKILEKIAEATGYTLINKFQIEEDWKKLVVFSNRSIILEDFTWPETYDIPSLFSGEKLSAFLRKIAAIFALGIFPNHQKKTLAIVPMKSLLDSQDVFDLTPYASAKYTIQNLYDRPDIFATKEPKRDNKKHYRMDPAAIKGEYKSFLAIQSNPPEKIGFYYIRQEQTWLYYTGSALIPMLLQAAFGMTPPSGDNKNVFWAEISPVQQRFVLSANSEQEALVCPEIKHKGHLVIKTEDTDINLLEQSEERLMLYRGINAITITPFFGVPAITTTYPFASKDPEYGIEGPSLTWHTKTGLYETWWKRWHDVLKKGKILETTLMMPDDKIGELRLDRIFKIQNQKYIAISFETNRIDDRIAPIKAKLMRI